MLVVGEGACHIHERGLLPEVSGGAIASHPRSDIALPLRLKLRFESIERTILTK